MKKEGKKVCSFIGVFNKDKDSALLEDMKQKYFKNMVNEEFMEFFSFDDLKKMIAENAGMEMEFFEFRQKILEKLEDEEQADINLHNLSVFYMY